MKIPSAEDRVAGDSPDTLDPTPNTLPRRCWACTSLLEAGTHCTACGKIQPLGRETDYFGVFGLPRRLGLDAAALEPAYHLLSRQLHPDRYRMAAPRERRIALEDASLVNQAYRTLRDPFERVAYLLRLEGAAGEAGGGETPRDGPPQELFEEILAVQELLAEFKFADAEERAALRPQVDAKRAELEAELGRRGALLTGELSAAWDALPEDAPPGAKAPLLVRMRRLVGERAYLRRVVDSLTEALV